MALAASLAGSVGRPFDHYLCGARFLRTGFGAIAALFGALSAAATTGATRDAMGQAPSTLANLGASAFRLRSLSGNSFAGAFRRRLNLDALHVTQDHRLNVEAVSYT